MTTPTIPTVDTTPATANGARADRPFQDRVVLITGASDGIGAATARLLAAGGAKVAVNYHADDAQADAVVGEIAAGGGEAIAVRADVTEGDQVSGLAATVTERLGPVDVLIANAAGLYGHDVPLIPFGELTWDHTERIVRRRLQALFYPLQAVLPGMLERQRGSIVVVGSSLSRTPAPGMLPISMAKAGVEAAVKGLAREIAPHVRINGVAPNFILTGSTRHVPDAFKAMVAQRAAVGRNGTSEDVAELIAFLASDRASYLTGSYVIADGGTSML